MLSTDLNKLVASNGVKSTMPQGELPAAKQGGTAVEITTVGSHCMNINPAPLGDLHIPVEVEATSDPLPTQTHPNPALSAKPSARSALPVGWQSLSTNAGVEYFSNAETGESTWSKPTIAVFKTETYAGPFKEKRITDLSVQ